MTFIWHLPRIYITKGKMRQYPKMGKLVLSIVYQYKTPHLSSIKKVCFTDTTAKTGKNLCKKQEKKSHLISLSTDRNSIRALTYF
jgi:hypothetical protein